ncbi:sigma factor-like helix-turn-helix DNA-binding protein [Sporofaciens musculi]|uniref:sigma factor-like helix-turn-helix DNA-binding protein n=1 Tax=Sporofaciens musculi TaxID=2681861 RepID=UPI00259FE947|nr:sigma factor-like helix-turn-helix DNA-binding protein [Sporofaciens musculi]
MDKYDYTGDRTKNYFTAYLQKCIRWKRQNYLKKKEIISNTEIFFDGNIPSACDTTNELLEMYHREELLIKERKGTYPAWDELSDQRLISVLMLLREEERRIIYQYVFEERTFEEIGYLNKLDVKRVKGIYYYAIQKIRMWMRGER